MKAPKTHINYSSQKHCETPKNIHYNHGRPVSPGSHRPTSSEFSRPTSPAYSRPTTPGYPRPTSAGNIFLASDFKCDL
ncbi:hypothetical protein MAR_022475 [Mya arenaria]|uniref:Uncharacterized protein n=2 Tax=Mya arenaria TaxID=6604 RepID=A0ABY7DMZ3_MYAAR|nr:hypothetical protein MAR_022475 [Mya arenaria]